TQSAFTNSQNSFIAAIKAAGAAACPKCMNFATGDNVIRTGQSLYNFTAGGCQNWTPLSCIGIVFNSLGPSFWGVSYEDEIGANGITPLQGPLQPATTGTVQNWLQQIASNGSGTCTVSAFSTTPGGFWSLTQSDFIIHGSATSGMNTPVGTILTATNIDSTHFTFPCPGVASGTYNHANDPSLTIEPIVNQWFGSSYIPYTAFATLRDQSISYSATHVPAAGSQQAQTNLTAMACWEGGLGCAQSLVNPASGNLVSGMADWADFYSSHSPAESYLISRTASHPYITDLASEAAGNELAWWARTAYGAYDPAKPVTQITQGSYINYDPVAGYTASVVSMSGNTITTSSDHSLRNIIPGITRAVMTGSSNSACNANYSVTGIPTSTSLTVALAATNFTGAISTGTLTFSGGGTLAVSTAIASGNVSANGGDPFTYAGSPNDAVMRHRGQTFTLSGTGNASFNGNTFYFSPENLSVAQDSNGTPVPVFNFRQVPNCSGTGGTLTIIQDNNAVRGRNASTEGFAYTSPQIAFLSTVEAVIAAGAAGTRFYNSISNVNGYVDHVQTQYGQTVKGGFTGLWGPVFAQQFAPFGAQFQLFSHPHWENGLSVPLWHGASIAGLVITRNQDLLFQPSLNPPDYGFTIDCGARGGSNGDILFCINGSEGPQTRTFLLSPYLQAGQSIVRYIANWQGISMTVLSAGTASDTLTLQAEDAVFYAFPATFAGRLQQPVISARLADVPTAAKIVVRIGYDSYTLDSGNVTQDCGAGSCTLNMDLGIGQPGARFFRLIYLSSNGAILATGDAQAL
ncbi:MAG TPA: hypothetical protein VKG25_06400, partial [Bryobacteraceae bacterium]|nr:hypothetical protein [Bryobacteraceae bacterium]